MKDQGRVDYGFSFFDQDDEERKAEEAEARKDQGTGAWQQGFEQFKEIAGSDMGPAG